MGHDRPDEPWHKIAIDIFYLAGDNYLLAADYYSGFPEIVRLQGTTSAHIIIALKTMFARYGIPLIVMSDNAPNLASFEINSFLTSWGARHDTSSPYIARSNGLAERNIQTVKQLLKKAQINNDDPFMALLAIRSSPLASGESPAELFLGRKIRSSVISFREEAKLDNLSPEVSSKFDVGDQVRLYNHQTQRYDRQGVVVEKVAPRSVKVETDTACYRRNDQDLRRSNIGLLQPDEAIFEHLRGDVEGDIETRTEATMNSGQDQVPTPQVMIPQPIPSVIPTPEDPTIMSRTQRGRAVRRPLR
jgi:hypothetical protein